MSESESKGTAGAAKAASSQSNRSQLPLPDPPFQGKIGKTYKESKQDWRSPPKAPAGAPNVVIILLDDVGFGQAGTFGGPVPTPNLDKLAAAGLRYNRFHTTAICGPSRAALITGRNHHNCGSGFLAEWATGFPSYDCMIPQSTATIGRILKDNGYNTSWFGKNHNTPDWESSVVGPFDRWPTGLGFDYFYGFIGGETHQYYPVLFENTKPVEPEESPEQGYHFMTDMTDRAVRWLQYSKSVNPEKPVLLYFAPGAAHAPHHVPKKWREKFKGQFDQGWDKVREETYQRQLKLGVIPASADAQLPEGKSKVSFEFRYDGGGAGKGGEAVLFVNGKEVDKKRIERTVAGRFGIDTFGIGCDTGSPVCKDYKPPFSFSGEIEKVDILLGDAGLSEQEERTLQEKFHSGINY